MTKFVITAIATLLLVGCAGDRKDITPSDLAVAAQVCEGNGGVRFYHIGGWKWAPSLAHRVTEITCNNGVQFSISDWEENSDE